MSFTPNKQSVTGMCTKQCSADGDCGASGTCVDAGAGKVCFVKCSDNSACRDGLICVSLGATAKVCGVEPT